MSTTFETPMDDVFTFNMDTNDENVVPVENAQPSQPTKPVAVLADKDVTPQDNAVEQVAESGEIDINAVLADMQSDINTASDEAAGVAPVAAANPEPVAESTTVEDAQQAPEEVDTSNFAVAEIIDAGPVVQPMEGDMSIADKCAALLQNWSSETTDASCVSVDVDQYNDMTEKVARFALEAMNEDEPKYTEKEMDVLHKKAQEEAAQAFDDQRQNLLAQMNMMDNRMKEMIKEKDTMKAQMAEIHETVKGFEEMTEAVAKKKDNEIYELFEAKKTLEQQNKDLEAKCSSMEEENKAAREAKTMVELEHSEKISTIQDTHESEIKALMSKLKEAEEATASVNAQLKETQQKLEEAEKSRAQFESNNKKLQSELEESNANCDKYKQIGNKTRDQAQTQLNKAKELVLATKKECANLKHTVKSLEETCKSNVEQLDAEKTAREAAEKENKSLKEQVDKQAEEMKQLSLEAYRCTKAEQELEKQKTSNKELYEMCNELMKQVEANKK